METVKLSTVSAWNENRFVRNERNNPQNAKLNSTKSVQPKSGADWIQRIYCFEKLRSVFRLMFQLRMNTLIWPMEFEVAAAAGDGDCVAAICKSKLDSCQATHQFNFAKLRQTQQHFHLAFGMKNIKLIFGRHSSGIPHIRRSHWNSNPNGVQIYSFFFPSIQWNAIAVGLSLCVCTLYAMSIAHSSIK